ncbi:MAG: 5'-nucleotidase C-terminal domain-containing protein [Clostridia bacterium]|nr:5'-nucleotidase C-terminal domain-containing protein [Clostridia bacterium]
MHTWKKLTGWLMILCLLCGIAGGASAATFVDAHGNEIELDETQEAYAAVTLLGADHAARKGETNLGDLWADALRWFAVSGEINGYFEEDDVAAGITAIDDVDADHIVALWNGGNLRADIGEGKFGAEQLAQVLPYPNKVAVVYMSGEKLLEALEAASQALPYSEETASACAAFMQAAGLRYTVDTTKAYDAGEAYGDHWFKAKTLGRVTIEEVNGLPFDRYALYAVITNNANFNGMDASYVFKAAVEDNEKSVITTAGVRDVIWLYIANALNNVIDGAYAAPQGRVTVNTAE